MNTHILPNGLTVKHANLRETLPLYQDIFEKRVYLQHGITLPAYSVVLDTGANIGLFTLFVLQCCPTASVHAFEPAPKTFDLLRSNTCSYEKVEINNCGLGSQVKEDDVAAIMMKACGNPHPLKLANEVCARSISDCLH